MGRPLNILHLEDQEEDQDLVQLALKRWNIPANWTLVDSAERFRQSWKPDAFDLVLSDSRIPGLEGLEALNIVRFQSPRTPFVFVCGHIAAMQERALQLGASAVLAKSELTPLLSTLRQALDTGELREAREQLASTDTLVNAVQQLSMARSLEQIQAVVRHAARALSGSDGATFVLREGDECHYLDEDAIAPLWKGKRFPLEACISGWAMIHRQPAVIEDIYADARIPHEAYRPTFVHSLLMVPIRTQQPVGAIGNYWATPHLPSDREVALIQALANSTAVALDNVSLYANLERRVVERTRQWEAANTELEAFSYSISHDLRAPLRSIQVRTGLLQQDHAAQLPRAGLDCLEAIAKSSKRMSGMIEGLLRLAGLGREELDSHLVDLSQMAQDALEALRLTTPERQVECRIESGLVAQGDAALLRLVLDNLLGNAWKYSAKAAEAQVSFESVAGREMPTYVVRDNGVGLDLAHASRLFQPFQRFHSERDFPGTGVGLATVQRIIARHGGRLWVESEPGQGANFFFSLPRKAG